MPHKMYRKTLIIVCLSRFLIIIFLCCGIPFTGLVGSVSGMARTPRPNEFIDFTLKDINGKPHTLSDYKGKLIFLNFWASWCPPCRAEMPSIQKLYEDSDKDKFVILAVDVRENEKKVKDFVKRKGYTFPILFDGDGKVARKYRVRAFPTTYIIDQKGKVLSMLEGARYWSWEEFKPLVK